jgi:hypothetical protein
VDPASLSVPAYPFDSLTLIAAVKYLLTALGIRHINKVRVRCHRVAHSIAMTKSKGLGRGGTRDGAGRPKIEKGKTATFATRITQRTRDLLDAEAERQANSVAAVAERLLRTALEKKAAEKTRPHELRRLFNLIETLLVFLPKPRHWGDQKYRWHSNPYLFEAFRLAIGYLMTVMRPPGQITTPPPLPPAPPFDDWTNDDRFALFIEEMNQVQNKYPESVDDHARDIARSVIRRAREQMRVEGGGRKRVTVGYDEYDWELPIDHLLADAARTLFDRGKK